MLNFKTSEGSGGMLCKTEINRASYRAPCESNSFFAPARDFSLILFYAKLVHSILKLQKSMDIFNVSQIEYRMKIKFRPL